MMILLENQTDKQIDTALLQTIADKMTNKDIELIFVDDEEIKRVNNAHRNINKPTDVLSFPLLQMPHAPLGTIIISVDTASIASKKYNHSLSDEVALLFIHGLLHLSGYDHECDEGQMREKESELIKEFKLPSSLIVRTELL